MSGFGKFFYAETRIAPAEPLASDFGGCHDGDAEAILLRSGVGLAPSPEATEIGLSTPSSKEAARCECDDVVCYDDDGIRIPTFATAADSGEPAEPRYNWDGRVQSPIIETDLLYARTRCFDPGVGRWINGDPLGGEANDEHRFEYVKPARTS